MEYVLLSINFVYFTIKITAVCYVQKDIKLSMDFARKLIADLDNFHFMVTVLMLVHYVSVSIQFMEIV